MKTHTDFQISNLLGSLRGEVIGSDDPRYDDTRRVFFTGFDRRPAAIVRAGDTSDVARVVTLARETGAELAVRSGGHSRAGDSTSEGGIVLDLSAMNAVEIDADGRAAWAQTGVKAGDYTRATGERGLATGLGDTATVGLGGIALSGGMGFLVRKHGLTIDDMLAAEVVTADGELLDVDEHAHLDLFWALRGGGGNFGVVTRLRLRLHEIDQVVGGMLVLPSCERRRDLRPRRRGGRGARGSVRHREGNEGPAAALHPSGAARQARGDGPYGLRGRARSW
jgi:FAD/FMN-containing dehydrogenase